MPKSTLSKFAIQQLCFPDELLCESPVLVVHHSSNNPYYPRAVDEVLAAPGMSLTARGIYMWLWRIKTTSIQDMLAQDKAAPVKKIKSAVKELVHCGRIRCKGDLIELVECIFAFIVNGHSHLIVNSHSHDREHF